ncbi:MAG: class C sortase [Lachnospiraceae bacterium]|nr:class C sortase [Lachnospiraceae bacterium]
MAKDGGKAKKKKKKGSKVISGIITAVLLVFLVGGLGVMLYPSVSEWWNSLHASRSISEYVMAVESIDNTELERILDEAREFNRKLYANPHFDLTEEEYAEYEKCLDISGTGIMGYISIPSISVNLPIYHGTEETVLQIAAGHLAGSSLPVGGESTHSIISGHRGLPSAKLFTDLDKLVVGDTFVISILNEQMTYRVDQIKVVLPEDTSELSISRGKDYCTLVTCTPYGINTHRMLVRGHRVENEKEELVVLITPDATKVPNHLVAVFIIIPTLIIMLIVYMIFTAGRKKNRSTYEILDEIKNDQKV